MSSFKFSFVLQERHFISLGVIASSPYSSLNGENFVVLDATVLCDKMTFGNSSTHLPFGWYVMFFLMPMNMMMLALSTNPLDYG
jgi:hypothetical protein